LDKAAGSHRLVLKTQAEIDGVRLLTSLAFEGFGAAIVPATAAPDWLTGEFKRIQVPELPRRVVGWVQRTRPLASKATQAVGSVVREVIEKTNFLDFIHTNLVNGFAEDDIVLECVMLIATICRTEAIASMVADSYLIKMLQDLLGAK
jgi:hypothetical protein